MNAKIKSTILRQVDFRKKGGQTYWSTVDNVNTQGARLKKKSRRPVRRTSSHVNMFVINREVTTQALLFDAFVPLRRRSMLTTP